MDHFFRFACIGDFLDSAVLIQCHFKAVLGSAFPERDGIKRALVGAAASSHRPYSPTKCATPVAPGTSLAG